jgi:magnesium transporter
MIDIFFKTIRDQEVTRIGAVKPGCWIHAEEATLEDLGHILKLTNLEMADIQDSLDKYESPRIEHKEGNIIIFVRHPLEGETGLHTTTLAILLTPNYFITISPTKNPLLQSFIHSKSHLATTQRTKCLFHLLLKITQDFTAKIKIVRNTFILPEKPLEDVHSDTIVSLSKSEELLNQYLSALTPMKNVLETITTGRYVPLFPKDQDMLQDLLIALRQSEELCNVNVKSIKSLRDSYQILFTNNVNKTIKFLTAITIIFTIPTIIASLYGMNIPLPFAGNPHAFILILFLIAILSIIFFWFFMKKKWL